MTQHPDDFDGVVICSHGAECIVERPDHVLLGCQQKRSVGRPVCGDHVSIRVESGGRWVRQIHERHNEFARGDRRGRSQVIAANVDQALICIAPEPAPTRDLVNRYLVACHAVSATPVIVINKQDLIDDADDQWHDITQFYGELGIRTLLTSSGSGSGIEQLINTLQGRISIFVGQSGVGKTSLINRVIPDLELQTAAISDTTGKGRHTTTTTTLYRLDQAGSSEDEGIIDSPGVWEYGLWNMPAGQIAAGFTEFGDFAGQCRFNNCTHMHEPGCAIKQAVTDDRISTHRHESYQRIVNAMSKMYSD